MDQSLTDLPVMSADLPVMTAGHVFGLDYDAPLFCFGKPALHALTTFLVPIMYGQFDFLRILPCTILYPSEYKAHFFSLKKKCTVWKL